jgi:thiamine pyrophosphate-dependent acetolactate synthase large subunit-like protein
MMPQLNRRDVVGHLLADGGDLLVVGGLGAPSWDITSVGDRDLNFPLWGAMGGAAMLGLGLALAQPDRRVVVVTGDGEALMGLTALSTIGSAGATNLALVVLDNEHYGETGMQTTNTASGTDIAAVATACGFADSALVTEAADLAWATDMVRTGRGPVCAVFKVSADVPPQVVPPRDGPHLVERFRSALAGD